MQRKSLFWLLIPLLLTSCNLRGQTKVGETVPPVVAPNITPLPNPVQESVVYPPPSIYVSLNGNDANDGRSRETAFASLQLALETARAGELILVLEGIYPQGVEVEGLTGPLFVVGEGRVIFDGERKRRMGLWCESCRDIVFDHLAFQNYTDLGIGVYLSDQIVMRNLDVANNGFAVQLVDWGFEGYGIMVDTSSNILVEGNLVYGNGPNPQIFPDYLMGTGINFYACTHCQMMYNQVYKNVGGTLVEDSADVLVEGNEIWENDLDASADEWWDGGLWLDGGHDIVVRSNIFRDNLGPGIEVSNEDNQEVYGYALEDNISSGNYFGVYIWNFGTSDFPDERILKMTGNIFENNARQDILIADWECPPDDPCE